LNFFTTTPSLNKTQIGEYFGEDVDLNKKVLYAYIDSCDFKGELYLKSMRMMLAGFRLPGEGQKVDRIMEKFGEKFCLDNPEVFSNAEVVYLLSYAVMMLQTSIHNPMAKSGRMKFVIIESNIHRKISKT
jgi:brefeldin A-inhibited guanine nucleotide-exchange protein